MNNSDLCQDTQSTDDLSISESSVPSRVRLRSLAWVLLVPALGFSTVACQKDEAPPPLPTAKPVESAQAPLELEEEEDGGAEEEEEKPKTGGRGRPASSIANCCAALRQNAASAPPQNQALMLQAAAQCDALAKSGQSGQAVLAPIRALLSGASLPAGCR